MKENNKTPVTKHHQAKVLYLDGKRCLIDKTIAPLIDCLFKLNIHTTNSCEADCGVADNCPF